MKSLLIVDDSLVSLKQINAQLDGCYEMTLAKSGALALQICAAQPVDLILLDMEMPGMDGFEVINRLKSDPALSRIPVIFLTGNHDAESEVKCLEAGAVDFIVKPAPTEILRYRIDLHLACSTFGINRILKGERNGQP